MLVKSLGFRTDLALLERSGSHVENRADHLVVRTPLNPGFYWGNFLLLDHLPDPAQIVGWIERFETEFPEARHRAIGLDLLSHTVDDLAPWVEYGFTPDASAVMTATSVNPPPRPNTEAHCRALRSDDDWEQSLHLQIACWEGDAHSAFDFLERRRNGNRSLVADGAGQWFGAFVDGQLVSHMGVVAAGADLARFQLVETHPGFRGRGLAGTLVYRTATYGLTELGAKTLVMVAGPEDSAIRVYRSVGFEVLHTDLAVERFPGV